MKRWSVKPAWTSQARAILNKKRRENKAWKAEEQQGTTSMPCTDQDFLISSPLSLRDTYSLLVALEPFRAIFRRASESCPSPSPPRAGGSASDRMLSFCVPDFLQARRWGTLQLCVGRARSPTHATGRNQERDNIE